MLVMETASYKFADKSISGGYLLWNDPVSCHVFDRVVQPYLFIIIHM